MTKGKSIRHQILIDKGKKEILNFIAILLKENIEMGVIQKELVDHHKGIFIIKFNTMNSINNLMPEQLKLTIFSDDEIPRTILNIQLFYSLKARSILNYFTQYHFERNALRFSLIQISTQFKRRMIKW